MKAKSAKTLLLVLALWLSVGMPAMAGGRSPAEMGLDALVARPVSLAATVVGSALFLVSLPFTLASGTVDDTAKVLVVAPAKDTFTRPLGDLDDFLNY